MSDDNVIQMPGVAANEEKPAEENEQQTAVQQEVDPETEERAKAAVAAFEQMQADGEMASYCPAAEACLRSFGWIAALMEGRRENQGWDKDGLTLMLQQMDQAAKHVPERMSHTIMVMMTSVVPLLMQVASNHSAASREGRLDRTVEADAFKGKVPVRGSDTSVDVTTPEDLISLVADLVEKNKDMVIVWLGSNADIPPEYQSALSFVVPLYLPYKDVPEQEMQYILSVVNRYLFLESPDIIVFENKELMGLVDQNLISKSVNVCCGVYT